MGLYARLHDCLQARLPAEKISALNALVVELPQLAVDPGECVPGPVAAPGRPERPLLVPPREVASRGLGTVAGRAALIHAIAHIEFNAINLALDAAWRFRGLPAPFARDWIGVAADEARHFRMLQARLQALGHDYGDFPAHDGLWEMAEKTAGSALERMALVPRLLEARGLDVTPGLIKRLRAAGDDASAEVLEIILAEEVGHVAIGSRWFAWCCAREGVEPGPTFIGLLRGVARGSLRGPFNLPARRAAGFDEEEIQRLAELVEVGP